jgi:uncharacterized membrane protein
MRIQATKQINILVFAFGAMCGASLGWALPDGNLLVTTFLAVAAGMFTLGIWLGFQFLRKLWVRR